MKLQILASVVIVAVAGCKAPEGAYVPSAKPRSPESAGVNVVLLNHELKRTLAMDKPALVDRDEAGRLRVQVALRNRLNNDSLHLQVQTLWKDDTGRVLYSEPGSAAPWLSYRLTPNQTIYYTQTALTEQATQYTIRVRYARTPR